MKTDTPAARHIFTCTVIAQYRRHVFLGSRGPRAQDELCAKTVTHPRVMFHLAPHRALNPCASSSSPTSLMLMSSSSPNPDLLCTHPFIHCEDPRQDGTSTEFHSSTGYEPKKDRAQQDCGQPTKSNI